MLACASACALFAPAAAAADIYSYANGCYALRDANTNRFVVRDALGYAATAPTAAAATPFRMQATALGRYLLYGPDGRMPSARRRSTRSRDTTTPGPAADWRVTDGGGTLRLTNVSTGDAPRRGTARPARPGRLDRAPLVVRASPGLRDLPRGRGERHRHSRSRAASPTARVRGFVDDHIHVGAFQFLGGRFHCGRPWSPYGVTVALQDCADH